MNRAWLKFVVFFGLTFLAASKVHQLTRERTAPVLVGLLSTRPSTALINLLTPSEHARAVKNLIQGSTTIQIGQGCDGMDGVLLLVAALLAFPAAWKRKAVGLAVGIPLLYAGNLGRIVSLYYVQGHAPEAFTFMHEYVGQTLIILIGFCFFIAWSGAVSRPQPA